MEMKAGTVITVIGEAMLELSHGDGDSCGWSPRHGQLGISLYWLHPGF